jgi:hypothetical protein
MEQFVEQSASLEAARGRCAELVEALKPFAEAAGDESFVGHPGFPEDGIAPTGPYGDALSLYLVAWPGEDHELRTDDCRFTLGDLRHAAALLNEAERAAAIRDGVGL